MRKVLATAAIFAAMVVPTGVSAAGEDDYHFWLRCAGAYEFHYKTIPDAQQQAAFDLKRQDVLHRTHKAGVGPSRTEQGVNQEIRMSVLSTGIKVRQAGGQRAWVDTLIAECEAKRAAPR